MTKKESRHLLDILAEVEDKRKPKGLAEYLCGILHDPLSAILGLAVIATMCGARSYSAIAEWGRSYPPELAVALGFTRTNLVPQRSIIVSKT